MTGDGLAPINRSWRLTTNQVGLAFPRAGALRSGEDNVALAAGVSGFRRIFRNRDVAIAMVAVAIFLFFSLLAPHFFSANVLLDIARRAAILGTLAVGMTFLFVAGELDLSIGSHYGFLLILLANLVEKAHVDPWLASLLMVGLGALPSVSSTGSW